MGHSSKASALRGFDVASQGTAEQRWRAMLASSALIEPPSGPLVVVAPHPDDETLGAGGLIHLAAAASQLVRIISVTDGEASHPGVTNLAQVRALERQNSLACLSRARVDVSRLQMPDGGLASRQSELNRAIDRRVADGDTLIAPYESDGHPDHDAVGRACLGIARRRSLSLLRYPIWAWHHASPRAFCGSTFVCIGLTHQAQDAKRRAIDCFTSQLRATENQAPIVPVHVLGYFARPFEAFLTCQT